MRKCVDSVYAFPIDAVGFVCYTRHNQWKGLYDCYENTTALPNV